MMRPPARQMFQSRLGGDEHAAQIDVDDAVHLFQRSLLERLGNGGAGIVNQNVQPAEGGDGFFHRRRRGLGIGGIGLNGDGFAACNFDDLSPPRRRHPRLSYR